MTTPTIAQKRLMAAGAIKSSAGWGVAQEITSAFGMLIETDGGLLRNQPYMPAKESDTPFVLEGDLGNIEAVEFGPEFFLRYDMGAIGVLIAQLFGKANDAVNQGDIAYLQSFEWEDENDGDFATFAIERRDKIFEVPSAKPHMLDLSIADGFLKGKIGLKGNTLINTSTVNELTEMDALTYESRGTRIKFSQLVADMNDQVNGDAAGETDLIISDIAIHYERPMDGPHKAGSPFIIEPKQNGQGIITVTMTFPRMSAVNAAYFADFIAETEKKLRLEFTGAVLGSSAHSEFLRLFFPRMRIINIDYPFDDIIPATITLQAEEAASAPTGMGKTRPYVVIMNRRSTDYLT